MEEHEVPNRSHDRLRDGLRVMTREVTCLHLMPDHLGKRLDGDERSRFGPHQIEGHFVGVRSRRPGHDDNGHHVAQQVRLPTDVSHEVHLRA